MESTSDPRTTPRRRRLRRPTLLSAALGFGVLLVLVAVLGGWLAPQDPYAQNLARALEGPGKDHWLGTDQYGRDTLSRLLVATRVTMLAVAQGVGTAVVIGIPLGLVAGYVRGIPDTILRTITDALLALPPLILALAIIGILGPGLTNAMIAVGAVLMPRFFRVARASAEAAATEMYVEAAVADGSPLSRILVRHLLPNVSGPLLVQISFGVGFVIAAESGISFLGLGATPPDSSWGTMIRDAFLAVNQHPGGLVAPTLAVTLTTLMAFVVGDGLRDRLAKA